MKRHIITLAAAALICSAPSADAFKVNLSKAVKAGSELVKGVTLSDEDVAEMAKEYMQWMDTHNPVASDDSEYGKRLKRITNGLTEVDGLKLNIKVYEVIDINAFACGDGSVRVCAGLMDVMSDNEVLAVIGHEIGHVVNKDSKDAMKNAYMRSAAASAAGAVSSTAGALTDSELGALADALADAQYSQKQENAADDYGFQFAINQGCDPYSMRDALQRLIDTDTTATASESSSSKFRQLFSSHPETEKRIKRMKEKADKYSKK